MKKTLESVNLSASQGTSIEVKVGDQVAFINPQIIPETKKKRTQELMIKSTEKKLGPQPYKIAEINLYPSESTMMTLEGHEKVTEEINIVYLAKA